MSGGCVIGGRSFSVRRTRRALKLINKFARLRWFTPTRKESRKSKPALFLPPPRRPKAPPPRASGVGVDVDAAGGAVGALAAVDVAVGDGVGRDEKLGQVDEVVVLDAAVVAALPLGELPARRASAAVGRRVSRRDRWRPGAQLDRSAPPLSHPPSIRGPSEPQASQTSHSPFAAAAVSRTSAPRPGLTRPAEGCAQRCGRASHAPSRRTQTTARP